MKDEVEKLKKKIKMLENDLDYVERKADRLNVVIDAIKDIWDELEQLKGEPVGLLFRRRL